MNTLRNESMSTARLEIIHDDDEPIQVCRSMPAALEGLVSRKSFCDFCDKIDVSMQLLQEAHKRYKRRIRWNLCVVYLWIFFFSFGLISYAQAFDSVMLGYILFLCVILTSVDYFVSYNVPRDCLTKKELMRKMRRDCEDMTLHTPHVSFHIVLQPVPPFQLKFLAFDVVDHIAVSVSFAATILRLPVAGDAGGVIASFMTGDDSATTCKIMEHEAATAAVCTTTAGNTAVVFAEAMISGTSQTGCLSTTRSTYQGVASDADQNVDLV